MARIEDNPNYDAGYEAYWNGETRDSHIIHPGESQAEEDWLEGWDQADSDIDDGGDIDDDLPMSCVPYLIQT